jgi:phage-related protein
MPEWEIYYYKNKRGNEPVKDFIDDLRMKDQVKIFDWISRLEELGPNAIRPLVEYLGDDIYELRVKLSDTESRILYFFIFKNCLILANAWNKKKEAASKTEYKKHIEIAKNCLKDYNDRIKGKEEL